LVRFVKQRHDTIRYDDICVIQNADEQPAYSAARDQTKK